jgi:hypothetical protein
MPSGCGETSRAQQAVNPIARKTRSGLTAALDLTKAKMKFVLRAFNRDVVDGELLQDLVAVATELRAQGKAFTFRAYNERGKYSASTIAARFGSWNDGLRKAGIAPHKKKMSLSMPFSTT